MVTSRLYPDHGGGALQALRLARKLAERNVESFFVTGHQSRRVVEENLHGLPVIRLPIPKGGRLSVLRYYLRAAALLWKRRHRYDLIHAHAIHHHSHAAFLAGRLAGKPTIGKISGTTADLPHSVRQRSFGGLQVHLMSLASRLVATSREMETRLASQGIPTEKIVRIPNGTDTTEFSPPSSQERLKLRRQLRLPETGFIGVFVGVLLARKGIDVLAKAWQQVASTVPDFHLLLVGAFCQSDHWGVDSDYIERIKTLFDASTWGGSRVHFVGQVPDVRQYLRVADLFIFPSRSEGMPNALLEAMACGLPFVATRLDVIEEVAPEEQQPYLVPVDDHRELASCIIELARQPSKREILSGAVRRAVEQAYSLDAVTSRYLQLYHELL